MMWSNLRKQTTKTRVTFKIRLGVKIPDHTYKIREAQFTCLFCTMAHALAVGDGSSFAAVRMGHRCVL